MCTAAAARSFKLCALAALFFYLSSLSPPPYPQTFPIMGMMAIDVEYTLLHSAGLEAGGARAGFRVSVMGR